MKKRVKCMIAFLLMLVTVMACAIPASATWMYPDGGSVYRNIVNTDNYNRTIYVYHRDNYGNLLKYCEYYTGTIGEYEVFGDSIYGYEITGYESNQGLGEQCVLTWASGNESTAAYGQIGYQFYKLISKKSLTLNFTYRVHEATTFNIKHYIVDKNGNKTLYDSSTASYTYGNNMSIYRKYPTGYSLRDGYAASITGPFTYDVLNSGKNVESRLYYDRVWGSRRGEMYDWKSFTWTNKDWLDYCRNREINVTFIYDIDKYTIDFNANGGSGAPTAITKYYGENITIPSTTPTRNGYTFKGWGTTINDTTPKYQPGSTYTSNSGRTLYAIWESNSPSTYTVSYNANGGSGAPASQTKTKDVILTLSSIKPTRNGYSFMGWSTSSTATAPTYSAGGSYTDNASVTLYAVWSYNSTPTPTPVTTYTVSYNANGGSGAPTAITKYYGENITIPSTTPTRNGYTFKGWGTTINDTTPKYQPGSTYTSNSGRTLYAIWESNSPSTYTVSYNANGGSGAPASQTKTKDVILTLSSIKPTRNGYSFMGWSTSSTATAPTYSAGGSYTDNASVTLYAVWSYNSTPTPTPVTTYTVSYNANGGSGAPASQSKTEGTNLVLSSATPYRSGYRFLGWSTSSTATYPTYYAGSTYGRDASVTLYAVWERTSSETYTIRYNANGGSGAPSTQYKTEGIALTLSSVEPSRTGYNFLGWSTSSTATSATYSPGDRYTANTSVTLYAVWEQTNYEFSISNLTVTDSNPYRYDEITVKVRTDSWDNVNPHSNIPVQLYYDGQLMSTQYVDFAAYGVANLIFTLYVGDTPGNHSIEARVNWQNRSNETNADNNSVSTSITVRDFDDFDYEMSVVPVTMSDDYVAGDTVISSFTVRNDSDYDIIPDMGNKAIFTAYYYDGSQKNVIANDTWNNVVIPSGKANLVYFKWTVPSNLTGKTVYCECTINADHSLNEENLDNNTSTFSTTIASSADSQTPDTRYESSKPNSYKGYRVPANSTEKATWTMWVYENNQFVLKTYGVQISTDSPVITPSAECKTAVYSDGKWTIRSGYGFTISYAPTITTVIGCTNPENSAYTGVQYAYATFPEFNYSGSDGSYRTLELDNGKFRFIANAYSIISDRVHFIPVWFEDGTYTVSVTASRVWTPAGMIHATRTANTFNIDGSIFDDYYVGN